MHVLMVAPGLQISSRASPLAFVSGKVPSPSAPFPVSFCAAEMRVGSGPTPPFVAAPWGSPAAIRFAGVDPAGGPSGSVRSPAPSLG